MNALRPYMLRAFHEWITDNLLTPFIVVNAEHENADLPLEYAENGKIILNVIPPKSVER